MVFRERRHIKLLNNTFYQGLEGGESSQWRQKGSMRGAIAKREQKVRRLGGSGDERGSRTYSEYFATLPL